VEDILEACCFYLDNLVEKSEEPEEPEDKDHPQKDAKEKDGKDKSQIKGSGSQDKLHDKHDKHEKHPNPKDKKEEDLSHLNEHELNHVVYDINNIDIISLLNSHSTVAHTLDSSTEADTEKSHPLFKKCEMKNAIDKKIFLDHHKLEYNL